MTFPSSGVDVAVIGGGVIGSAAAWRLATRGRTVTLLEQFEPGHDRGASHGTSRIFRHAYDAAAYVEFAAQALVLWRELEQATGREVLTLTGAVDHGLPEVIEARARVLGAAGLRYDILEPVEAEKRWPGLRFDTSVLYHPDAGRVHADGAVSAFAEAAANAGATVRYGAGVREVIPTSYGVDLVLEDETVVATRQVVFAAGAWTEKLFRGSGLSDLLTLPSLRTTQEQPAHFAPLDAGAFWPSFIHHPGAGLRAEGIYGLGSEEGIKIGEHGTGSEVSPESRTFVPEPEGVQRLVDYASAWLPGVDVDSVVATTCLYTTTPDSNFVIDRSGPVTVAGGFSGHGFKFAPAVGELVADLVDGVRRTLPEFRAGDRGLS